jgi:hypothetical protein
MDFMTDSRNDESLKFYLEIQEYKNLVDESPAMKNRAKLIFDKYINDLALQQINIKSDVRKQIEDMVSWGSKNLFDSACSEIMDMVKKDVIPR